MTRTSLTHLRLILIAILCVLCLLPSLLLAEGRTPWDYGVDWQGDSFIYRYDIANLIDSCYLYVQDYYGLRLYRIDIEGEQAQLELLDTERAFGAYPTQMKFYGDTLFVGTATRVHLFTRDDESLAHIREEFHYGLSPRCITDDSLMVTDRGIVSIRNDFEPELLCQGYFYQNHIIVEDHLYYGVPSPQDDYPLIVCDISDPRHPQQVQYVDTLPFGYGFEYHHPVYLDSVIAFPSWGYVNFARLDENLEVMDTYAWDFMAQYPYHYPDFDNYGWIGVISDTLIGVFSGYSGYNQYPILSLFDPDLPLDEMHIATIGFYDNWNISGYTSSTACTSHDSLLLVNNMYWPMTRLYWIASLDTAVCLFDTTNWNYPYYHPTSSFPYLEGGILITNEEYEALTIHSLTEGYTPTQIVSKQNYRTYVCDYYSPYLLSLSHLPGESGHNHWYIQSHFQSDTLAMVCDLGSYGNSAFHSPHACLKRLNGSLYCAIRYYEGLDIFQIYPDSASLIYTLELPEVLNYVQKGLVWDDDGIFLMQNDSLKWFVPDLPDTCYLRDKEVFHPVSSANAPANPMKKSENWLAIGNRLFRFEGDSLQFACVFPHGPNDAASKVLELEEDRVVLWTNELIGPTVTVLNLHEDCFTDTTAYIIEGGYEADILGDTLWIIGVNGLMRFELTGYSDAPEEIKASSTLPTTTQLEPAFPNPFNPSVTIPFSLASSQRLSIEIFDILGRRVTTLTEGLIPAGHHQVQWQGKSSSGQMVSAGTYFVRMRYNGGESVRKVLLLK